MSGHVSVQDVMNTLPNVDADNPLDFVLKATSKSVTVPEPKPAAPAAVPEPQKVQPQQASVVDPLPVFDAPADDAKQPETPAQEAATEEDDIDSVPDDPVKENYLKLKSKAKEAVSNFKQLKVQHEQATQELERYKKGEVIPEVLQNLENKVAELSKWEKLYNLESSEDYQERYIKPLGETSDKLKALFKDYGATDDQIDAAVNHALKLENKADLNKFLAANFDVLGAEEAKSLISTVKQLQSSTEEARKEPIAMLERLQAESAQIKQAQDIQRMERIKGVAKDSWVESLLDIRQEGKLTELIRQENNPEFNKKYVEPILTQAANEYGKLVTELARQGVKEISKDLAKGLATMVLRATAQGVAVESREAALDYANQIKDTSSRVDALFRPAVGGGVARPAARPAPKAITPESAADALLNKILPS